jgi:mRNA interferase HigB
MRIISRRALIDFWDVHCEVRAALERWYKVVKVQRWASFAELRRTFSSADQVRVGSGKTAVVFNIGGNNTRLVAAVHYNTEKVFVLRILSHSEYGRGRWKDEL